MARSLEERFEDLIALFGDVPRAARRLEDYQARQHQDIWVQRLVGTGISCQYVIGYQLGNQWWTFCFDRRDEVPNGEDEHWVVEAYDSEGGSWCRGFRYSPISMTWSRAAAEPVAGVLDPRKSAWA